MNPRAIALLALLSLPAVAAAQTGYTITGAMSNFDCTNRCDYETDEMEIEIEGVTPQDILHTYTNGNYGSPTVTLSDDGTHTIVDYRNPQHLTSVNSVEHFGVTIRGAAYYTPAPYHPTRVHWYRNGHLATVNGQIPNPDGNGSSQATQPLQPSISANMTPGSHGTGGVSLTVTNNDPLQSIWIKRSVQITSSPVTLEALMPNDPIITSSTNIDPSPIQLAPLQVLTASRDLIEVEEAQSAVFSALYYQNILVSNGDPFDPGSHETFGAQLGNIMTATLASPNLPCAHSLATIVTQPASVTQAANSRVDLRVSAHGDDNSPLVYQWMKEGVALTNGSGFSGVDSSHLRIDHLTGATEGFYSVQVTNVCNTVLSDSALVFITGHNQAPVHTPPCAPDYNGDGILNADDLADFVTGYFNTPADPRADFNVDGVINADDLGDFVTAYFNGC